MFLSLSRRKNFLPALLLTATLGIGSQAQATSYTFSSAAAQFDMLGNDGTQGSSTFDRLILDAVNNGTVNLTGPGSTDTALIPLTFQVGISSSTNFSTTQNITWGFTFNGITKTLTESATVDSRDNGDNLFLFNGQNTIFDLGNGTAVKVTPQDFTILGQGIGDSVNQNLQVNFTVIPEASTMIGFGGLIGAGGVSVFRLRRRKVA